MAKNKTGTPLRGNSGYSLAEFIIIVMFLGILAAIAVPRLNFAIISKQKADTVARKMVTDLRRTRRLAISGAANNSKGYELELVGTAPYNAYEIENMDSHETVDSHTTGDVIISGPAGRKFKFGPLGELKAGSAAELTISAEGKSFTITIIPATGAIKCVEN